MKALEGPLVKVQPQLYGDPSTLEMPGLWDDHQAQYQSSAHFRRQNWRGGTTQSLWSPDHVPQLLVLNYLHGTLVLL